jgi:demethylmenaquinone methyltransferase/2-methoxy-6-polyprenyl-1,4-benzoquinol methylase
LPAAFSELGRVVAPGGGLAVIDITGPTGRVFGALFRRYFRVAAPALGRLGGHPEAYRYLVRSLAHLPPPAEVCGMLRSAGFVGCVARPLTGGTVTLFTARRERR